MIDLNNLKEHTLQLIRKLKEQMPDEEEEKLKDLTIQKITELVEQNDHLLPFVGQWADLPFVDQLQKEAIRRFVLWVWSI